MNSSDGAPGATTRNVFLTFSVSACVAAVTMAALSAWLLEPGMERTALEWLDTLHSLVWAFIGLAVVSQIAFFVWVHRTWAFVIDALRPEDAPSPTKAVLMLLTPLVNIVWQFEVIVKPCSLVNDALVRTASKRRAPTGLAILWCLIGSWGWAFLPFASAPYVVLVVPLVGYPLMRGVDLALRELTPKEAISARAAA